MLISVSQGDPKEHPTLLESNIVYFNGSTREKYISSSHSGCWQYKHFTLFTYYTSYLCQVELRMEWKQML